MDLPWRDIPGDELARRLDAVGRIFPELAEDDQRRLAEASSIRHVPAETTLKRPGDPIEELTLVLDGLILVRRGSQVADVLGPGEFVALPEFVLGLLTAASMESPQPTSVLLLPGDTLLDLSAESPFLWRAIAHHLAVQVTRLERDQTALASADSLRAIAWRMYELSTRWGHAKDDADRPSVPLTQEDLGTWAGVSRESTVKALRTLRSRGLVQTGRRQLRVLDPPGLRELVRRGTPHARGDWGRVGKSV